MDIVEIMSHLPHRYPMMLVDKVLEIIPHTSIKTLKNVTINENFFTGHFPNNPIMPGVLIVESIAQSAGLLSIRSLRLSGKDTENAMVYFLSIDECKFKHAVKPGDTLIHHIICEKWKLNVAKYSAQSFVNDKLVAELKLSAMIDMDKKI